MKRSIHFYHGCIVFAGVAGILTGCLVGEREPKNRAFIIYNPIDSIGPVTEEIANTAKEYQNTYGKNNHAVYFSKDNIATLIDKAGADYAGIRVYRSVNDIDSESIGHKGAVGMIMVAVDGKKNDITTNGAQVIRSYVRCPNACDDNGSIFDNHN